MMKQMIWSRCEELSKLYGMRGPKPFSSNMNKQIFKGKILARSKDRANNSIVG